MIVEHDDDGVGDDILFLCYDNDPGYYDDCL